MKIKWLGHSCFLLTSESGVRLLTDPYDPSVGYKPLSLKAQIVTTSHGHSDHSYTAAVQGDFIHIGQPGRLEKSGIGIEGVESFHDKASGAERGRNTIFCFDIDSLRVCHCGDLGHLLTDSQVKKLGKVDILLIPVGGYFTIDASEAAEVVKQLKPAVVIPMHYNTEGLGSIKKYLATVDKFLSAAGMKAKNYKELEVNKSNLREYEGIALLKYD